MSNLVILAVRGKDLSDFGFSLCYRAEENRTVSMSSDRRHVLRHICPSWSKDAKNTGFDVLGWLKLTTC